MKQACLPPFGLLRLGASTVESKFTQIKAGPEYYNEAKFIRLFSLVCKVVKTECFALVTVACIDKLY